MVTTGIVVVRLHKNVSSNAIVLQTVVRNDLFANYNLTNNDRAINLLQSWLDAEDELEQRETWEYLQQHLDEDRLSDRKLFP